ncbi:MAG: hypothetical protein ACPGVU_02970, partial [Limisphaerales bacterium]
SLAMAARVLKFTKHEQHAIHWAFELTLGRHPTAAERQLCLEHWKQATAGEKNKTYQPKRYDSKAERTVMAEKTGEPYDFIEHMPAYDNYQPDLQPSQVDAHTRGLAQVCLVLFNSNEFAYLD